MGNVWAAVPRSFKSEERVNKDISDEEKKKELIYKLSGKNISKEEYDYLRDVVDDEGENPAYEGGTQFEPLETIEMEQEEVPQRPISMSGAMRFDSDWVRNPDGSIRLVKKNIRYEGQ